jgi:hypothetical protein
LETVFCRVALYEIVFRWADGNEHAVVTNVDPRGNGWVTVHGLRLEILKTEPGDDGIEARFIVWPPPDFSAKPS